MNVIKTPLEGLLIIEPKILHDDRGYFFESYNAKTFEATTGLKYNFVQDNQARSTKNVLRGLHYQNNPVAQTKLIRALEGAIWDVVVDIRKNSATYGQWFGVELSAENKRQLLVPQGFAHGYSVITDTAEVFYKCDNFYNKEAEGGVLYSDESIGIDWKIDLKDAIVSEKDLKQPLLKDANNQF
ncbi:MAG: dTDP-4-dehydrorhamnose 3,5-epimerase [Sphingobacteriales bacterium]|nr:MAG: dTDP-4-dehydrorhamnose 3,5-epimerase [Sphingobacteriales bacterium]